MPQILDQLYRDHRNMRSLLHIIEDAMAWYKIGGAPDFDLLLSVMDYTRNYPNLVHHPKEDMIYRRLLERDPSIPSAIGNLLEEHQKLGELTQRFEAALRQAAQGVALSRDGLDELAQQYLAANRQHIDSEDRAFFPRAVQTLTDEDWEAIDAALDSPADPLFGHKVEDQYLALHERIMQSYL